MSAVSLPKRWLCISVSLMWDKRSCLHGETLWSRGLNNHRPPTEPCICISPQPRSLPFYWSRSSTGAGHLLSPAPKIGFNLWQNGCFWLLPFLCQIFLHKYIFVIVSSQYLLLQKILGECLFEDSEKNFDLNLIFTDLFSEGISPAQTHTVLTTQQSLVAGGHLLPGHSYNKVSCCIETGL